MNHPTAISFTPRQLQVIEEWATQQSVAQAADQLKITESTFLTHLKRMRGKLGVNRTVDVYLFVLREGLLPNTP